MSERIRFISTGSDGRVRITSSATKKSIERVTGSLTDAEFRALVLATVKGTDIVEVPYDDSYMPDQDRRYRDAWRRNSTGEAYVDMPAAREIHRDLMRFVRKSALRALDHEYSMADEEGDNQKKKEVAARKKLLRDVTALPEIDAAQTPDDLRKVWPEYLPEAPLGLGGLTTPKKKG